MAKPIATADIKVLCGEYIRVGQRVLDRTPYLTEGDRKLLKHAIELFQDGLDLIDLYGFSEPSTLHLVQAAHDFASVVNVSSSEAAYWEKKKRGGPKKTGGKRDKKVQANRHYLNNLMRSNPECTPSEIVEKVLLDETRPVSISTNVEYLTKMIRKEMNELKATGCARSLKLVHG